MSDDIFKKILKKEEARPTCINWPEQLQRIADEYAQHKDIPHGVQKDAVQNSWDARKDKKRAAGWSVAFRLVEGKSKKFLTVTDRGTYGLTGRVLTPEEMQEDLSPEERWGRFENLAFTKGPSEKALGSRGQGKFIFVAASKEHRIMYDTLRNDSVYRFGVRSVEPTESPVWAYEGEKGAKFLATLSEEALKPLTEVGTRVIIVEPSDEVVSSIRSGAFLRYIEETWWEIIQKYDANITVEYDGKSKKVALPPELKLPEKDERGYKVWLKKNFPLNTQTVSYKIKKLHILRKTAGPVPEDLRGVAIQRGGMKICSIPMKYVSRDIVDSVYGYIWLDDDLEMAMRPFEDAEHYGYAFGKGAPKSVKQLIEDELQRFGREKLGCGVDPRKILREQQKNAEIRAQLVINRIAKKLGFFSGRGGGKDGGKRGEPPPPPKEIRVEMPDFEMPRASLRVNYGETLKNIKAKVVNDCTKDIDVRLKMSLFKVEGGTIKNLIEAEDIHLSPKSSKEFGPFELVIDPKVFASKGRHSVRATLVSMMEGSKGDKLHKRTKHFWVEEEPPEPGIFEKVQGTEFPAQKAEMIGSIAAGEMKGYIYYYNLKHPAYDACPNDEEALTDYLLRAMAEDFSQIDLRAEEPKLFSQEEMESPEETAKKVSKLVGKIMQHYYATR